MYTHIQMQVKLQPGCSCLRRSYLMRFIADLAMVLVGNVSELVIALQG